MTLLNEKELDNIAALVSETETTTDAELICVMSHEADNYYYIPTLWAALTALIALPIFIWFSPFWLDINDLLIIQWGSFIFLALLLRIPRLKLLMVPKSVKIRRASNLARRQFLEQNLHCTHQQLGVLIFVSEAEHYVEILVDAGVRAKIDNTQWNPLINHLTAQIKAGDVEQGFHDCIKGVSRLLAETFPATCVKNELPNRMIVI